MEESFDLTQGIKGVTIGRQPNADRPVTSLNGQIGGTQNTTKSRLPRLYVNDHGRRKGHQEIMKIKLIINNEKTKGKSKSNKKEPLDCFTITPLNPKKSQ